MTTCPKCREPHEGGRTVQQLLAEGSRVIAMALDLTEERARQHLFAQWYGGALEIGGCCTNCIIATLAIGRIEVSIVGNGAAVRDEAPSTEESGGGVVLQFRAPAKDAPHLGQTFDSGEPRK